eukprot:243076-Amphidinium_carterae.1
MIHAEAWSLHFVTATEQLKKHWMEENRDMYQDDFFCKQAVENQDTDIALMCYRCLKDLENDPLKYCHKDTPEKPSTQFRHMVASIQHLHKHTVRYLDIVK